jgi:glucosyl-dolichyl phosphate glucuronosyltransferase
MSGRQFHPEQLRFSVVICAYTEDRWDQLAAALRSVGRQSRPAWQTIVAVDHCPPLARRLAAAFPEVTVVASTGRPGLSGARNTGLGRASGEVVAFLDDDAVPAPDWLERLAGGYGPPEVVGVGGAVLPAWEADRPGWFPPSSTGSSAAATPGCPGTASRCGTSSGQHVVPARDLRARRRLQRGPGPAGHAAARLRGDRAGHPDRPAPARRPPAV